MERKEAIEVVKKNYPHVNVSGSQFETALRTLIPELKESEDEKWIPKEIAKYLKEKGGFRSCWVAWLEKQGKNNIGISEATKQKLEDNLNKALEKETTESLNKFLDGQGEQKPAEWSEDDQSNFNELSSFILETYRTEDASRLITWLESLKERIQPQPKQEWSEEDESNLQGILDCYKSMDIKWRNWLKSLRPQKQQYDDEWKS